MTPPVERPTPPLRVLPPGQEKAVAAMLGKGRDLPDGCAWSSAAIDRDRIVARYRCAGSEVEVVLLHPEAAPPGALRAGPLSLVVPGNAPPGFAQALEARVRESGVTLSWVGTAPRSAWPREASTLAPAAAAVGVLASVLAFVAVRWYARRRKRPAAPRRPAFPALSHLSATRRRVATACAALATCTLWHGALFAAGWVPAVAVLRKPPGGALLAIPALLLCVVAGVAAFAALRDLAAGRTAPWLLAAAAVYAGAAFSATLPREEPARFGGLLIPYRGEVREMFVRRPPVTYRFATFGFREPAFDERKGEGTLRIALVGDSYVFGSGVELEGTLASRLAATLRARDPGRPVEVLNLGVQGHNLTSHVDLYAAAVERLAPDAVVLCLTLPNDLGRWDFQDEMRDASRPSLYAFGRFLVGRLGTQILWDAVLLERRVTPRGLAHLREEVTRLAALRRRGGPPLVVFAYFGFEPPIRAELSRIPGAVLVESEDRSPDDFIPDDGHPTASGNARFAAALARYLPGAGAPVGPGAPASAEADAPGPR